MIIGPTADDIAIAIVAACRETGDDPIATAQGGLGIGRATNRARHFALHALVRIFPKTNVFKLCEWVGCPGKPKMFWNSSWNQVVKPRASGLGHVANWFDDEIYDRVIRAIEADRTRRAVAPRSAPTEKVSEGETLTCWKCGRPRSPGSSRYCRSCYESGYRPPAGTAEKILGGQGKSPLTNLGRLEPSGHRPPVDTIKKVLAGEADKIPVFDRSGFAESQRHAERSTASKSQLYAELAAAAANTAKMQSE